jgi:hypothetical protein
MYTREFVSDAGDGFYRGRLPPQQGSLIVEVRPRVPDGGGGFKRLDGATPMPLSEIPADVRGKILQWLREHRPV